MAYWKCYFSSILNEISESHIYAIIYSRVHGKVYSMVANVLERIKRSCIQWISLGEIPCYNIERTTARSLGTQKVIHILIILVTRKITFIALVAWFRILLKFINLATAFLTYFVRFNEKLASFVNTLLPACELILNFKLARLDKRQE